MTIAALICSKLTDFTKLEEKSQKCLEEMEVISELTKKLISENACGDLDNEEYNNKYTAYTNRFEKAKAEYDKLQKTISERKLKAESVSGFMFEVSELPMLPMEFNEKLWDAVIDTVTVYNDDRVVFKFKNGKEIEEML